MVSIRMRVSMAANNDIFSGMYNYKVSDLSLTQDKVMTFDIDYILMRFAEVMFIYAEAANENGHSDVAIDLLKQIRKRAGIEAGADGLYGLKVGTVRRSVRRFWMSVISSCAMRDIVSGTCAVRVI